MKKLAVMMLLIGGCLLWADPAPSLIPKVGDALGSITTVDGKVYPSATLTSIEPDGISVLDSVGGGKIPFEKLPTAWQQRFGYNPQKAALYAQQELYEAKIADLEHQVETLKAALQQRGSDHSSGPATTAPSTPASDNPTAGLSVPPSEDTGHSMNDVAANGAITIDTSHNDPNIRPTRKGYLYFFNSLVNQSGGMESTHTGAHYREGPLAGMDRGAAQTYAQRQWEAMSYDQQVAYEEKAEMFGPGRDPDTHSSGGVVQTPSANNAFLPPTTTMIDPQTGDTAIVTH